MQPTQQNNPTTAEELADSLDHDIDSPYDEAPENDEQTYCDGSLKNECW